MITLGTLKTHIPKQIVSRDVSGLVGEWAYWVLKDLLRNSTKCWFNKKVGSFTTVASQAEYILDDEVNGKDIIWMGDPDREGFEVKQVDLEDIYFADPSPTDAGDVECWALVGQTYVNDKNEAAVATVVSSSNDDNGQKVTIRGKVNGVERYAQATLNGTSNASPDPDLTWDEDSITQVSLSAAAVGVVTVTTGSTTIVSIPPGQIRISAPRIRIWRIPETAVTLPYMYHKRAVRPVNDSDTIEIPDEGHEALLHGVRRWGHLNQGQRTAAREALEEYASAKEQFYIWCEKQLNKIQKKRSAMASNRHVFSLPDIIDAEVTE